MLFERHFAAAIGRFRIDVTTADRPAEASESNAPDPLGASIEEMKRHFVRTEEAFAAESRKRLERLRKRAPGMPDDTDHART